MLTTSTDELDELRAVVRAFLSEKSTIADVRRLAATTEGYDRNVWQRLTRQLRLPALAVPSRYGGDGFGVREQLVVLEEMGAALLGAPYLATVLATTALLAGDDEEARQDLLPRIVDGAIVTLAVAEEDSGWGVASVQTTATRVGDAFVLDGRKVEVLDGHVADILLVAARAEGGVSLFAVDGRHPMRQQADGADRTRRWARVDFAATPARLIGGTGDAADAVDAARRRGVLAVAAEQTGGARRCLELSVEYAKRRHQFGQPIGTFQAIRHRCADMLLEVESAAAAVRWAAEVHEDRALSWYAAHLAKACCSEAYSRVSAECLQVHGSVGFVTESPVPWHLVRAGASELLFGRPDEHLGAAARHVVDGTQA